MKTVNKMFLCIYDPQNYLIARGNDLFGINAGKIHKLH